MHLSQTVKSVKIYSNQTNIEKSEVSSNTTAAIRALRILEDHVAAAVTLA